MDDRHSPRTDAGLSPSQTLLVPLRRCAACLAIASAVWAFGGCSVFVMAGKMFFGDPEQIAAFRNTTGVDLTKGEKSVLVIATAPESVRQKMPGVDLELAERVGRHMRTKGVKVYPSKKLLDWIDDRGGQVGTPDEIAAKFDADYIVEIAVDDMTNREDRSPDLYRGRATGNIRAYEVVKSGDRKVASPCFSKEFRCTYPSQAPKAAHQISEATFQYEFVSRVCSQVAQMFCDYRASETVY
jgi:hypothetical protein